MKAWRFAWPLAVFLALAGFLYVGLYRDPREVPSPLVNKPVPAFSAPSLHAADKTVTSADFLGAPWVLNVWASWCQPCRDEHPVVIALAKNSGVRVVGLNYKDARPNALRWLSSLGDPYVVSLHDQEGRVGLDLGVYGVPETYIMDAQGIVRVKHVGPLSPQIVRDKLDPVLRTLKVSPP
jgi:cytochrome c biogenesis protein CcmG, thiol:disulfide interchange protein DsbE